MHATVWASGPMVERLDAIVKQFYKGNLKTLRAAVDERHCQRIAESRIQRDAYSAVQSCRDSRCTASRRGTSVRATYRCGSCGKEEKRLEKAAVAAAEEDEVHPTVAEMSQWEHQVLFPKLKKLSKKYTAVSWSRNKLAILIKVEEMRLR